VSRANIRFGDQNLATPQGAKLVYEHIVANSLITTTHNNAYSLFSNVQNQGYWSGTEYSVAAPDLAGAFNSFGDQGHYGKLNNVNGLAESPGQVNPVPLPAAALLMFWWPWCDGA
jgi:hypothetical protein